MKNFIRINTTEEEQVAQIKHWIKHNIIYIISGVVLGATIIGGWNYYDYYHATATYDARTLYLKIVNNANEGENERIFTNLKNNYPNNIYTEQAQLMLAKYAMQKSEFAQAAKYLESLLDSQYFPISYVATLRLSETYLAQKKFSAALDVLDKASDVKTLKESLHFRVIYFNLKGDIYYAQKEFDLAKENYEFAVKEDGGKSGKFGEILLLKIANLF